MGFLLKAFISGVFVAIGADTYRYVKERIKGYEWVKRKDAENE